MLKIKNVRTALSAIAMGLTVSSVALTAVPAQAGALSFLKKVVKREVTRAADKALADVAGEESGTPQAGPEPKLPEFNREKGTTVPTADDVQAPQDDEEALLLPAVQAYTSVQGPYQQRSKMTQNGTTVETASEVQAPDTQRPQRAKLKQNGTRVATASEVQAPTVPQAGTTPKLPEFRREKGTTVATADDVKPRD